LDICVKPILVSFGAFNVIDYELKFAHLALDLVLYSGRERSSNQKRSIGTDSSKNCNTFEFCSCCKLAMVKARYENKKPQPLPTGVS